MSDRDLSRAAPSRKVRRGFALLSSDRQREIAARGGAGVPAERRSFSVDRELASRAGRAGGRNVDPALRSFSRNRALAVEAGRKGGRASQRGQCQDADSAHDPE